jgi:polysaccharide chain length determinant protein (PEP-CTERM system associated)
VDHHQEQPSRTLAEYWAIIRRRRWWLILPLFFIWTIVLGAGRFISPRYRSETVIIVEQQRVPDRYLAPTMTTDVQEWLQSMTQQILSRTRLLGIIRRFRLYAPDHGAANDDGAVESMRHDIKIDLVPSPGRQWELSAFKVSYSAPNAALAQQVTQELISVFIEENLRSRQRASESTTEFLESQLQEAGKNLAEQEQRLREFKSRNLGELPEQLQNTTQILASLETRLQTAEEAADEANQQELSLQSLLARYRGMHVNLENGTGEATVTLAGAQEQLDKLNGELADLKGRYTSQHPDVQRLQQEIAVAEQLKKRLQTAPAPKSGGPEEIATPRDQAGSPMLELEGQIRAIKIKVATREKEVKMLRRQVADYQARVNLMPVREEQLAAITRDHDQSRANYESLLAKKTQSEMAADLEKRQQGDLFSIIDPPNLPQKPYWPNRFKLSLLGLALGTFVAAGITAAIEAIDSRIDSEDELRNLLTLPVLVGIPLLQAAREQWVYGWRRRMEALAASLLLAVMPLMTLFAYYRG